MKELRFTLPDGEWRVAFAFDPRRAAILLAAGSKSGVNERRFYRQLIRTADARFAADEVLGAFTPEQRARVETRAQELIEEELTLRDLRHAQHLTQERMAELLGVEQENVSRIERRADLLLSTLASYVAAMGGKLRLIAEFPDRKPVAVALGDLSDSAPAKPRRRSRDAKAQPAT